MSTMTVQPMPLEQMPLEPMALELVLPWNGHEERDKVFRKILRRFLILLLLLFLLMPWLEVFEKPYEPVEQITVTTKLILDPPKPKPLPPPPPIFDVPLEEVLPPPKPAETKPVANPDITNVPKPVAKAPKVADKTQIAKKTGLSELSSQLKSLRGSLNVAKMQNKNVSTNTGGNVAAADRDVLGVEGATRKSKGIQINEDIMKGDDIALAEHYSTEVEGVIGGDAATGDSRYSNLSNQAGKRDMESIRRTLESVKSSVQTFYQQALLDHPDLEGKFVFSLVIEPNGSISSLQLVASELGLKELENKMLARIKQVNFGAKDVSTTKISYQFVFFPS
jgi:hypothetical protein